MAKRPINVEVTPRYPNEPIDRMIRRFTKKIKKERIMEDYREKRYYEKPSEKRKKDKRKRIRTLEKLQIETENMTKQN